MERERGGNGEREGELDLLAETENITNSPEYRRKKPTGYVACLGSSVVERQSCLLKVPS